MKKNTILVAAAAIACLCGCAKSQTAGKNDASKKYFDAWITTHKENSWKQTEKGAWIIKDIPGTGEAVGEIHDSLFVRFNYTYTDLKGDVKSTSDEMLSKQIGVFVENDYFGPQVYYAQSLYAGFDDILKGMKVGGTRKAVLPGWLITYERFNTPEDYLANASGEDGIYEIELTDIITNINKWECDSIASYVDRNFSKYGKASEMTDTVGFWYVCTKPAKDTTTLRDTTVYINYIGRLLNGTVFDTNIRDTAMRHGLYSDSKNYAPISFDVKDPYPTSTMGDEETTTVKGFARTISKMHAFEEGSGIFMSELGYFYSGSGNIIPAYSPLRFDIQIVKDPNE